MGLEKKEGNWREKITSSTGSQPAFLTMLFHSSLRKELSRIFGATLVVLITIVMTMVLIRTLGLASEGRVNPSEVFLVMAYTVLGYLPMIMGLSLFVAIVGTLSRMYRDSEMVIWFSSGQGLASFLSPLLRFSWPVLVLIAVLALVVWPWANQQTNEMRYYYQNRSDIDRVAPGEFQESAMRNRVFFIDKDTARGTVASNVFISSVENIVQSVTSSHTGHVQDINGTRFLVLNNGQRMERSLQDNSIRISQFEEYGARLNLRSTNPNDASDPSALSTLQLLRQPTAPNRGQFTWRIGLILAALNLIVLGLTISNINPRAGSSNNFLVALFAYVIYYNLLNLGEKWVGADRIHMSTLLVALHGGMLAIGLLWLAVRHNNWSRPAWLGWPRLLPPLRSKSTS